MSEKEREEFREDFKNKIKQGGTVEIKDSVAKDFEIRCVNAINTYANKVHDWREKSLQETLFIG